MQGNSKYTNLWKRAGVVGLLATHCFRRMPTIIGTRLSQFHVVLRTRPAWMAALLFLGLSSMAAPLAMTQQSGLKNQYMLPLDLGDDWRTRVTITNLEEQQADLALFASGSDGRLLVQIPTLNSLAAKEAKTLQPRTIAPSGSETLRLQGPGNLIASVLLTSVAGTKGEAVPSINEPSQQLDFPPLLHADVNEKRINLLNTESSVAGVEVIALEKSGLELGRSVLPPLSSMASYTVVVRDVFGPEILSQLSTIRLISNTPIVGVQLVDPADGDLVGLPALNATSQEWSFPIWSTGENVELWTAVGLYNAGGVPTSAKVESFDVNNTSLGIIETIKLPPGAVHGLRTANLGGQILQGTVRLRVSADAPISGYAVVGSMDGRGVTATLGIPADDETRVGFELVGSIDNGILAVSPLARMMDGSVSSTIGTVEAGYWTKKWFTAVIPVSSDRQMGSDSHNPHLPTNVELETCASELNAGLLPVHYTLPPFGNTIFFDMTAANGPGLTCRSYTWNAVENVLSLLVKPLGMNRRVTSTAPNQAAWDCSHSSITYAVYTRSRLRFFSSPKWIFRGKGTLMGTTPINGYCQYSVRNFGGSGLDSVETPFDPFSQDVRIAAIAWSHDDPALGHLNYCSHPTDCFWRPTFQVTKWTPFGG
jgi:hypothetical protein